jgi:hypothetical protein
MRPYPSPPHIDHERPDASTQPLAPSEPRRLGTAHVVGSLLSFCAIALLLYLTEPGGGWPEYRITVIREGMIDVSSAILALNLAAAGVLIGLWRRSSLLCSAGCLGLGLAVAEGVRQVALLSGPAGWGALLVGAGVGALVGSLVARTRSEERSRVWASLGLTLLAAGMVVLSFGLSWLLAVWLLWAPLILILIGVRLTTTSSRR